MSVILNKAAGVLPPIAGGVYTVAHDTSMARYEIPPDWQAGDGNYVTLKSLGDTLFIAFGDGGVTISATAVAQSVGEVIVPNAGTGYPIAAGESESFVVPKEVTHFAVISDAATSNWTAYRSSSFAMPLQEPLPADAVGAKLWLDALEYKNFDLSAGDVSVWRGRAGAGGIRASFAPTVNSPAWISAVAAATLPRPAVQFVTASTEHLVSTDADVLAILSDNNPFTLAVAFSRAAVGAAHTLFSGGTAGSNNGRFDIGFDASDDLVIKRATPAAVQTTATFATTVAVGTHTLVVTFDGTTTLAWLDGVSVTLSGTATGSVGTLSRVAIGSRTYNTSTNDSYLSGEVTDLTLFDTALADGPVTSLNAWMRRRVGV